MSSRNISTKRWVLAVAFCTLQVNGRLSSSLGPVVDLGYAAFAGNTTSPAGMLNSNVTFFGGIPFAEPPLGNLRWRAPVSLDESGVAKSVVDARNWGPACLQSPAVVGIGSEDCLTVNVWKPTNANESSKLPVVAYIHGGGFFAGTPQGFPLYDWVSQHPGGLVGVSITYRLGLMGFLASSSVKADGDLNVGLLDQRAGLEWIQRHVAKFGGDPAKVSIYGESAGGASVIMQMTAFGGTKPAPFIGAVAESIGFGPTPTQEQYETTFRNLSSFIGCPTSASGVMPCLRNASIGAIVGGSNHFPSGAFSPVIEGPGGFMPDLPSRLIHSGNFSTANFIGGHTTGDGKTFAGGSPDDFVTEDDVKRIVFSRWPSVTNETMSKALAMYPLGDQFPTQWDRAWNMAGEIVFTCMDWFMLDRLVNTRRVKNTFAYSWDAPDAVLFQQAPFRGAAHTSDLYFLFDGTNRINNAGNSFTPFNASEALLSREAIAYWSSFASDANPSTKRLAISPVWAPFAGGANSTLQRLRIDRGADGASVTGSQMEAIPQSMVQRCQFWMGENVTAETLV